MSQAVADENKEIVQVFIGENDEVLTRVLFLDARFERMRQEWFWGPHEIDGELDTSSMQQLRMRGTDLSRNMQRIRGDLQPVAEAATTHSFSEHEVELLLGESAGETLLGRETIVGFLRFSDLSLYQYEIESARDPSRKRLSLRMASHLLGEFIEFDQDLGIDSDTEKGRMILESVKHTFNPSDADDSDQDRDRIQVKLWPQINLQLWAAYANDSADQSALIFIDMDDDAPEDGVLFYWYDGEHYRLLEPERVGSIEPNDNPEDSIRLFDRVRSDGSIKKTKKRYLQNFSVPLGINGAPIVLESYANPVWFYPEILDRQYREAMYEDGYLRFGGVREVDAEPTDPSLLRSAFTAVVLPEWWLQQIEQGASYVRGASEFERQSQVRLDDLVNNPALSPLRSAAFEVFMRGLGQEELDLPQSAFEGF